MAIKLSQVSKKKERCVIAGTGSSLTDEDVRLVIDSGLPVIAINDNWRKFPDAEYLWACDARWWLRYGREVIASDFSGKLLTIDPSAKEAFDTLTLVPCTDWHNPIGGGLSRVPGAVTGGYSSGHQAIHYAYNQGFNDIILVGFDMQGQHWFGSHPAGLDTPSDFQVMIRALERLAVDLGEKGVSVTNCSRQTALTCFARAPLEQVLRN